MPTGIYQRTQKHKENISKAQLGEKNHQWGKRFEITPVVDRFWKYVKKTKSCWIWTSKNQASGYGRLKIKGKHISVHRFSYELHKGKIPVGLFVCHSCDNRLCVNPDHLWLGTNTDNIRDMEKKGRSKHPNKENHWKSKFSISDIKKIREKYKTGYFSKKELAKEFGTCKSNMASILQNKTWKL